MPRTGKTRVRLAAVAVALACALAPATAAGATFCVSKPGCTGSSQPDLQAALDAAAASAEDDRIEIGPGTFVGNESAMRGFAYQDASGHKLEIVGSGEE